MTPPRLIQLRCPRCLHSQWIIDSDFRGISDRFIHYSERPYLCPHCNYSGTGYAVLKLSPPEFLLQPHPMYPMRRREFDFWAEILRRHFPDHPKVMQLGNEFHPNTHIVLSKLQHCRLHLQYRITAVAMGVLADIEDALHIDLTPEPGRALRQRALQTQLADIRTANAIQVYISYSHHPEDSNLAFRLADHLHSHMHKCFKTIEHSRNGFEINGYESAVRIHCNRVVTEGSGWHDEFEEGEFRASSLILILMSPYYLASAPCRRQLQQSEERSSRGGVKVVPILLRAVDWNPSAGWIPLPTVPISDWPQCEEAFDVVLEGILAAVPDEMKKRWVDDPEFLTNSPMTRAARQ